MRCVNCGWDNANGATTCVKCGRPLNFSSNNAASAMPSGYNPAPSYPMQGGGEPEPRKTVVYNPGNEPEPRKTVVYNPSAEPEGRKTVVFNPQQGVPTPENKQGGTEAPTSSSRCIRCGYPILGGTTVCPNCGQTVTSTKAPAPAAPVAQPEPAPAPQPAPKQEAPATPAPQVNKAAQVEKGNSEVQCTPCMACGEMVPESASFCPSCGAKVHKATMRRVVKRVFEQAEPEPQCTLTPIAEEDENLKATQQQLEGKSIILNRDNTEPGNLSITSKQQAELTCENGEWYIDDKSEYKTTFIQVLSKRKLESGDVIMLGDRRFLFEVKNSK